MIGPVGPAGPWIPAGPVGPTGPGIGTTQQQPGGQQGGLGTKRWSFMDITSRFKRM